ncbi:MAG: DapH/DapD/GlmU-related protein [Candidatus Thermoplasmatota archaeon]|nr:DapH/DapD/GlmU-related protein [Candidatus Thermoplasmatota archaeon]
MTRYRDGYKGSIEKYDFSFTSIRRALSLILIPVIAYIIGLLPVTFSLFFIIRFIEFTSVVGIVLFTTVLVIEFFIFIIAETFIPGLFIRLLRLKIKEGEYDISIKDKDFYKYSLYYVLYRPSLKLIGILPLLPLRVRFLKLVGLKMGKSSVLAGSELIHDPYMLEIGEQTLIGGWSQIAGHLAEKKLIVKKVTIGDNCLIGGKSVIMPGAIIEDNVTIALNSVVIKDAVLQKGKMYGGTPAKLIGKNTL